jgi:hypothetical protein
VIVTRDQRDVLARRKREKVVVAGIGGADGGRAFRIGNDLPKFGDLFKEAIGLRWIYANSQLRMLERSLRLGKERGAEDELEFRFQPQPDEPRRRPGP